MNHDLNSASEAPVAMVSSCSPSAGESLTSSWARDVAQLREMHTAQVAAAEFRSEKRSGAAEALEVYGGESFAVR